MNESDNKVDKELKEELNKGSVYAILAGTCIIVGLIIWLGIYIYTS